MQTKLSFVAKIIKNIEKVKNPITITELVITITTMVILLSSPVTGLVSVWAENFFGTSGPDTLVGRKMTTESLDGKGMII